MAKRILVIPDVHGRTFWKASVERYLDTVDRIVFLGDYLDPYGEFIPEDIFNNLMEIIELKNRNRDKVILLKGNHDQHYYSGIFFERAAGSRLSPQYWGKYSETFNEYKDLFQLIYLEKVKEVPYLFSHAGLTAYWIEKVNSKVWKLPDGDISVADPNIVEMINKLDDTDEGQEVLAVVGNRRTRIGGETTGSLLWADVHEYDTSQAPQVYGLNLVFQVFGHTRLRNQIDMIDTENFAMIDSQQCFMIDENLDEKIVTLDEYKEALS